MKARKKQLEDKDIIALKYSPYYVNCDEDYKAHIYLRRTNGLEEVTDKLTDEGKNQLIEDLVFVVSELLKNEESEEQG